MPPPSVKPTPVAGFMATGLPPISTRPGSLDSRRVSVLSRVISVERADPAIVARYGRNKFGLSLLIAPSKGIDTGAWLSWAGLGHAVGDLGTVDDSFDLTRSRPDQNGEVSGFSASNAVTATVDIGASEVSAEVSQPGSDAADRLGHAGGVFAVQVSDERGAPRERRPCAARG